MKDIHNYNNYDNYDNYTVIKRQSVAVATTCIHSPTTFINNTSYLGLQRLIKIISVQEFHIL